MKGDLSLMRPAWIMHVSVEKKKGIIKGREDGDVRIDRWLCLGEAGYFVDGDMVFAYFNSVW